MQKSKIYVESFVIKKISDSTELTEKEKTVFLNHLQYMTKTEREDLAQLV